MKAAIVNPVRNRKYIEDQFNAIESKKILEWVEKNKPPQPPSADVQLKEAMDGKIIWGKVKKGCSCSRYDHSRAIEIPMWSELIKTPSQEEYIKAKRDYDSEKEKAKAAIHAERKQRYEAVMFSKEDFLDHSKAFAAFKV